MNSFKITLLTCAVALVSARNADASQLALSSASGNAGSQVVLTMSLSAASATTSGFEWNLSMPASEVSFVSAAIAPGPAGAGKSLFCSGSNCLVAGQNASVIPNGTLVNLTLQLTSTASGNLNVQLSNAAEVLNDGTGLIPTTLGGVISVNGTPPAISISVSPGSVQLNPAASQQFTATVTGSSNTAVTWSASGPGIISASGMYTAPATMSSVQTATITATSAADPTKTATATATIASSLNAPTISGISPAGGAPGQVIPVTITGTNFVTGATVGVAGAGVTQGSFVVLSSTQMTAVFTIAANATLGADMVTVSTPAGVSNPLPFNIGSGSSAPPAISSISPSSGAPGQAVPVTITGTNFLAGATVNVGGTGGGAGGGQWQLDPASPTTRGFEAHDLSNTPFCPSGVGIGLSSRSVTAGNTVGLWSKCGTGGWNTLSTQPVSSWVVTAAGAIVYSQLTLPAQGLTGPAALPITLLAAPGATPQVSSYQGDVRRMAIDRLTGKIYALQVDGSVFVSTDGGKTFGASNPQTQFAHANATGAMGVRPSDGAVFVGDEVEPVEMLLPGASAWVNVGASSNASNIWFTPDNSAWACDSNNYPHKWDGASSWNIVQVASFVFRCHDAINAGSQTFITGNDYSDTAGPHVFQSSNNGASWTAFESGLTISPSGEAQAIGMDCSGTLWMATDEGAIPGAGVFSYANAGPGTCGNSSSVTPGSVAVVNATTITAKLTVASNAAPGAYNVTVTTSAGTSGAAAFTVNSSAAPGITSISPSSGTQGQAVPVTITGVNFLPGVTVNVGGTGVTAGSVAVVNATSITATLTIASNAAVGAYNVTVKTSSGTSNSWTFTVNSLAPGITSISPSSGTPGQAVPVTITGVNFLAGATVTVSGTGVTAGSVVVVNPTTITATLTIAASASTGARNVTVSTSGGTSSSAAFTVNSAAPGITSISPSSGTQGQAVPVTITGVNFLAGATVTVSGTGVTAGSVVVVNPTSITATLMIASSASTGARNVTVTTSGGTSGSVAFTVNSAAPGITNISPSSGTQGQAVPVTITGVNFLAGATVNVSGTGVTAGNVAVVNATSITATLTIASSASTGAYNVTVTTSGGTSTSSTFTVNSLAPGVTNISPSSGTPGQAVPVTITGVNFLPGATVNVSGTRVTAGSVVVVNATSITATLTIASSAAAGAYSITVTTPAGTSNAVTFAVQSAFDRPPTITSIAPPNGKLGEVVHITISGANFVPGATVWVHGPGVTQGDFVVLNSTTMTAVLTILESASVGTDVVTVKTPAGTSNGMGFPVQGEK
jgi:predicted hotdog family 3-hydroxylacyl-ACP dehydratase